MQLQQFVKGNEDAEKKRTQDAQAMAKEQGRLESLAIGFGLKPGEAKSMSSLELDKFVNTQMTFQVEQQRLQKQQLELQKFLQDQEKFKSEQNFRNQELQLSRDARRNANRNTDINMMNATTNRTNQFLATADRNKQIKNNNLFLQSVRKMAKKDPEFAKQNALAVEIAKSGGSADDVRAQIGTGQMTQYQMERLGIAKKQFTDEQKGKQVNNSLTLEQKNSDGEMVPMTLFSYKGSFATSAQALKFKKEMIDAQGALNTLNQLIEVGHTIERDYGSFFARAGGQLNPLDPTFRQLKRKAETLSRQMIGKTRIQLLGPGVLSNYDINIIESIFGNPADVMQFYSRTTELQNVRDNMIRNIQTAIKGSDLELIMPGQTSAMNQTSSTPQGQSIRLGNQNFYKSPGGGVNVTSP